MRLNSSKKLSALGRVLKSRYVSRSNLAFGEGINYHHLTRLCYDDSVPLSQDVAARIARGLKISVADFLGEITREKILGDNSPNQETPFVTPQPPSPPSQQQPPSPQPYPQPYPQAYPQPYPQVYSQPYPQAYPQQQAYPQPPQPYPQAYPQPYPQAYPQSYPQAYPQQQAVEQGDSDLSDLSNEQGQPEEENGLPPHQAAL